MHATRISDATDQDLSLRELSGEPLQSIDATASPAWVFHFARYRLTVETLWRLVDAEALLAVSEDHGQVFGLPAPIDVAEILAKALAGRRVVSAAITRGIGDLTVTFDGGARLQVLTSSKGYENWTLWRPDGTQLVCLGSGDIAVFRATS